MWNDETNGKKKNIFLFASYFGRLLQFLIMATVRLVFSWITTTKLSCIESFAYSLSSLSTCNLTPRRICYVLKWKCVCFCSCSCSPFFSSMSSPICLLVQFPTNWRFIVSIYFTVTVIHCVYVVLSVFIAENYSTVSDMFFIFFIRSLSMSLSGMDRYYVCVSLDNSRLF